MLRWILRVGLIIGSALGSAAIWRWWHVRRTRPTAPDASSLIQQPDEPLILTRSANDSLMVCWSQPSPRATVYLNTHPDTRAGDPLILTANGTQSVEIPVKDSHQRIYAEVVFDDGMCLKTAERFLPFENAPNFRDIGGYVTETGQRVRWNRVYRSSRLSHLSAAEQAYLEAMGITLVCDLRTKDEIREEPDTLPDNVDLLPLAPDSNENPWLQLARMLFDHDYLPCFLRTMYTTIMIDQNPHIYGALMRRIAQRRNLPLVMHCAVGKDRTGIAAALLLRLLGVSEDVVVADYTLSNRHYTYIRDTTRDLIRQLARFGIPEQDCDYFLVADGATMHYMLDYVRTNYGSVEDYLRNAARVDDETLEQVKLNLLE